MSTSLLEVTSATVHYAKASALGDVSITLAEGESIFVIGPNGAGKTTLLRAISGLEPLSSGSIRFRSRSLTGMRPWDIVRLGVAHVPQNRRCFGPLSVEDNLVMGAYTRPRREITSDLDAVYELFPVLRTKRRQRSAELSGGQQQMVAIGRALMTRASLLMLDEPSLGLAPMLVDSLGAALCRIRDTFTMAILIVEQNVKLGLCVGSRGYVLRAGKVVAEGQPDQLRGQLRDAYLGKAST